MAAPFVKWAGGKGKLSTRIAAMVPPDVRRYHEPFVGGGAVFFAVCARLGPVPATLNDLNEDLATAYRVVKSMPTELAQRLRSVEHSYLAGDEHQRAQEFYRMRSLAPEDELERAARLIFLNKTCFNGLYRVNRRGMFNVPHGRYARPRIADAEGILAASFDLQGADITSVDFQHTMDAAGPGDFVYLDPPYQPLSRTASFTSYTSTEFGWTEQVRLRDAFEELTRRHVTAVLSNAWQKDVRGLYAALGYSVARVSMSRAINSNGTKRAPIPEMLVTNFGRLEVEGGPRSVAVERTTRPAQSGPASRSSRRASVTATA